MNDKKNTHYQMKHGSAYWILSTTPRGTMGAGRGAMGGEWLICDVIQNDHKGRNDHKFWTTLSTHVSFSPHSFVTRQKNGPPEADRLSFISKAIGLLAAIGSWNIKKAALSSSLLCYFSLVKVFSSFTTMMIIAVTIKIPR